MTEPQTLQEAIVFFADKEIARQYLVDMRWPHGVACPRCGGCDPSYITTRKICRCKACYKQFSVKAGTIFEDSHIGKNHTFNNLFLPL
jgi:transposase-like protein